LASRATLAGILGLVSLAIPLQFIFYSSVIEIDWTVFSVRLYRGASAVFNLTQYNFFDALAGVLGLITVLVGGILLLALHNKPRNGAILVTVGAVFYVLDLIYDEAAYRGFGFPLPLGFFLMLAGGIIGLTARPLIPISSVRPGEVESSTDRLIKLKGLLDSGAITKEEFEEQKRIILQPGRKS